jgi:hypothetical protein
MPLDLPCVRVANDVAQPGEYGVRGLEAQGSSQDLWKLSLCGCSSTKALILGSWKIAEVYRDDKCQKSKRLSRPGSIAEIRCESGNGCI